MKRGMCYNCECKYRKPYHEFKCKKKRRKDCENFISQKESESVVCRICTKSKHRSKFDHGKKNCMAIEDVCTKCVRQLRNNNIANKRRNKKEKDNE